MSKTASTELEFAYRSVFSTGRGLASGHVPAAGRGCVPGEAGARSRLRRRRHSSRVWEVAARSAARATAVTQERPRHGRTQGPDLWLVERTTSIKRHLTSKTFDGPTFKTRQWPVCVVLHCRHNLVRTVRGFARRPRKKRRGNDVFTLKQNFICPRLHNSHKLHQQRWWSQPTVPRQHTPQRGSACFCCPKRVPH